MQLHPLIKFYPTADVRSLPLHNDFKLKGPVKYRSVLHQLGRTRGRSSSFLFTGVWELGRRCELINPRQDSKMHSGLVGGAGLGLISCGCVLGQCELVARCTCRQLDIPMPFVYPQWV